MDVDDYSLFLMTVVVVAGCRCMNSWTTPVVVLTTPLFVRLLLSCQLHRHIRSTSRCIDTGYVLSYVLTMTRLIAILILYFHVLYASQLASSGTTTTA